MRRLLGLAKRLLPADSAIGRFVRRLVPSALISPARRGYRRYVKNVEPGLWSPRVAQDRANPLFSVVIPMFNTPERYLAPLVDSLINQSYPHFEAILADASTDPGRAAAIKLHAGLDARLSYIRLNENRGISANTNEGLSHATAPFVAFVDHDDALALGALNEVAARLAEDPDIDVFYSDEDLLTEDGVRRKGPSFKPDWQPHLLLNCNYTNHLSVVRRTLVDEIGGLRPDFDGAQDYDMLLRLHSLGRTLRVVHIPLVLYHWREAAASTAKKLGYKAYAVDAGRRALAEYLRRVGVTAEIDDLPNQPSWFRIKPRWPASVAVVSAGEAARLGAALQAATSTACQPTWLCQPGGFEASAIPGDVAALVVLQKPFAPSSPDWLDDLVGALALPGATAVAPLLDNDDAGAVNPNVAAIRRLVELDEKAFLWPDTLVHDAPSVPSSVVAVKTGDVDLLDAGRISVPPERGRCVVWGPQRMVAQ